MPTNPLKPLLLKLFTILIFIAAPVSSSFADEGSAKRPFTIDDYFKIKRFTELALSSDGEMVAYAVASQSLEENKNLRHMYISGTAPGAETQLIDDIQDAGSLAWIPGTHELAFLSGREGITQIFSYDLASKAVRQHTESEDPVTKFRFAPDGQSLAYITADTTHVTPPYNQLVDGDEGVVMDLSTTEYRHFIDPTFTMYQNSSRKLWLDLKAEPPIQIDIPGSVTDAYWSSDSEKLSLTYVADDVPASIMQYFLNSVAVFHVNSLEFELILAARSPEVLKSSQGVTQSTYYFGGEWIFGEEKIVVRRSTGKNALSMTDEWAVIEVSKKRARGEKTGEWSAVNFYSKSPVVSVGDGKVFVETNFDAVLSLFHLTSKGVGGRADFLQDLEGSSSLFRFSADFQQAAFVYEDFTHPPEINIWRNGRGIQRITDLNAAIAGKVLPAARKLSWKNNDGVDVHGWLIEPVERIEKNRPLPLITYIHGTGPSVRNAFAARFNGWPYPFEAYALNGMAVFFAHHHPFELHIESSKKTYSDPTRYVVDEPIGDILSGVRHLVREGIADPERLGISGHSNGAWLGPMAMTQAKIFRAGSFAELTSNHLVGYAVASGDVNRITYDALFGASMYENPDRYIRVSPEFHFQGLSTAVLFEAGNRSAGQMMLSEAKAAGRAGMPTEYIGYPKTGHSLTIPRLRKESAERNLDWFRFWLKGEENPDPAKAEQYERWRDMRDERCARDDLETPSYCSVD